MRGRHRVVIVHLRTAHGCRGSDPHSASRNRGRCREALDRDTFSIRAYPPEASSPCPCNRQRSRHASQGIGDPDCSRGDCRSDAERIVRPGSVRLSTPRRSGALGPCRVRATEAVHSSSEFARPSIPSTHSDLAGQLCSKIGQRSASARSFQAFNAGGMPPHSAASSAFAFLTNSRTRAPPFLPIAAKCSWP